MLKSSYLYH